MKKFKYRNKFLSIYPLMLLTTHESNQSAYLMRERLLCKNIELVGIENIVFRHPAEHAEGASSMLQIALRKNKNYCIRTWSDWVINRVRMDCRDRIGLADYRSACILYVDENDDAHAITFDRVGNLEGAPDNFGKWQLKEIDRLIGI